MFRNLLITAYILNLTKPNRICPTYIQNMFQEKMVPSHIEYNQQGYLIWKVFKDRQVLTSLATPPNFKYRNQRHQPTQIALIQSYTIIYQECQLVIFAELNETAIHGLNIISQKYSRTHFFQSVRDQDELLSTALMSAVNQKEFSQPKCSSWQDNHDQNTLIWILTIISVAAYFIFIILIAAIYKNFKKC